jgi:hypothetical protein
MRLSRMKGMGMARKVGCEIYESKKRTSRDLKLGRMRRMG